MTYPIPPDARAQDDFDIVRGFETMDRRQFAISDTVSADPLIVAVGEPVAFLPSVTGVVKIDDIASGSNYIVGSIAESGRVAGLSFSEYNSTFAGGGHPDALKTGGITVLQGKFSCRYIADDVFNNTLGVVPAVGLDVVAVYIHNNAFVGFTCLTNDPAVRYAGANPTAGEVAVDQSVIGKVSSIDGENIVIDFNI